MKGLYEHYSLGDREVKKVGSAALSTVEFKRQNDPLGYLRIAMDGFPISDGKYVRLYINHELVMSDTDMEKLSNRVFCSAANGRVLIAGLGIGLVLYNIMDKPEVTEIIVIEKFQDVIDLVAPYFISPKIKIICADIMEWKPSKPEKFDTIYFDIWPSINTDNLEEIKVLHNRFKHFVNRANPKHYMDSWMKRYLQNLRRSDRRENWWKP